MARPQILQRLKHGKLLCKRVFASFVETWNYIVNRTENLKGDADANPQSGHIKIDNTDPEHPIMRLVNIQDFGNADADIQGDSDLTNATTYSVHVGKRTEQEGGETYATLYNFDQTPSESATATLDSNQGQYDVGSNDWFLVKNGNQLKYKKITIETDLPGGGGGGGDGMCGAFSYDEDTHTINDGMYLRARQWTTVSSATVSSSGYAYLQIDMSSSGGATIVTGASSVPNVTAQQACIPLYYFDSNLKVEHDYRGAPTLQIWEYS